MVRDSVWSRFDQKKTVTTLGKTLLVMGDSVMEQFYNTLQCLAAKESLKVRDRGRYGEIRGDRGRYAPPPRKR